MRPRLLFKIYKRKKKKRKKQKEEKEKKEKKEQKRPKKKKKKLTKIYFIYNNLKTVITNRKKTTTIPFSFYHCSYQHMIKNHIDRLSIVDQHILKIL